MSYLLTTLPAFVKVGPYTLDLVICDPLETQARREWGHYDNMKHQIVLQQDWPSVERMIETLIHELLHAIWRINELRDGMDEEETVSRLAIGLLGLLSENPNLVAYLQDQLGFSAE